MPLAAVTVLSHPENWESGVPFPLRQFDASMNSSFPPADGTPRLDKWNPIRNAIRTCGVLFVLSIAQLNAGSVIGVANGPEVDGKLTLNSTTIHVEGSAAKEINLPDVLEADFEDSSFHLDYFCSNSQPDHLPPDWKAQNIGKLEGPGSYSYGNGTFKLTSGSHEITD